MQTSHYTTLIDIVILSDNVWHGSDVQVSIPVQPICTKRVNVTGFISRRLNGVCVRGERGQTEGESVNNGVETTLEQ